MLTTFSRKNNLVHIIVQHNAAHLLAVPEIHDKQFAAKYPANPQ